MRLRRISVGLVLSGLALPPLIGCSEVKPSRSVEATAAASAALNPGCTGSPNETPGAGIWAYRYGDAKYQRARQVEVDPSGDLIVTGYFNGNIDFGNNLLINTGGEDAWLGKFDPSGNPVWSFSWGSAAPPSLYTRGIAITTDGAGNIFLAGQMTGDADLGGGHFTSAGLIDVFITKRSPSGAHLWSKLYGDASMQYLQAVDTDQNGDLFVVGYFDGTIDFGGGPLVSAGGLDVYVAKLDGATGDEIWARRYGDGSYQDVWDLAVDGAGGIVFGGNFGGIVDFGGGPKQTPAPNDFDPYVVHLDAAGNHVFSNSFPSVGTAAANCLTLDDAGNVFLSGSFQGTLDFGIGPMTATSSDDVFLAKLDSSGNPLWSQSFPGNDFQRAVDMAADSLGNVVIVGRLKGSADLGGGLLTSAGDEDVFIAQYDSNGALIWGNNYGDNQIQGAYGVTIDGNDDIVATGRFNSVMDFGTGPLVSAGNRDIFLAKFAGARCLDACAGMADGTACDDGDACSTGDSCQSGVCVPASGCDDGNSCTDDTCDPVGGCLHGNNTAACDDGDACTTGDVCQSGVCAGVGQGDPDGDGVCSGQDNCPNDYNPLQNDADSDGVGDACTSVCIVAKRGVSGTLEDTGVRSANPNGVYGASSDGLAGTLGGGTGYVLFRADLSGIPAGAQLTSASLTTALTSTAAGTLLVHRITAPWTEATTTWNSFASAFDAQVWTSAGNGGPSSFAQVTFDVLPLAQAWYDGTYANEGLLLKQSGAGNTKVSTSEATNPANRPAVTVCYQIPDPPPGCANNPDGTPCDDGDACTLGDTCQSGACVGGAPMNCDDANACTDDSCDSALGACAYVNNTSACDDGDPCSVNDVCQGGLCVGNGQGDSDSDGVCDVLDNCVDVPNPSQVDTDGDGIGDACAALGTDCSAPLVFDGTPCDDGSVCTQGDACLAGACVGAPLPDADQDGVCDAIDNCISDYNPLQADADTDGVGDACTTVCLSVQRGTSGSMSDTTVSAGTPTSPVGPAPSIKTGIVNGGTSYGLLQADLAAIPSNALVVSSSLVLQHTATSVQTVNAHRITGSWIESKATWNNFLSTFSPTIETSLSTPTGSSPLTFDLTALTQAWVYGLVPNDGVLLEQAAGSTVWTSSEGSVVSSRPMLTVCYVVPDPSCANGASCDDGDPCTSGDTCYFGNCSGTAVGDLDSDGVCDASDNCVDTANPSQVDSNADGVGDACANCTTVADADQVAASLAWRLFCNDDALALGPSTCGAPQPPSCSGSLVDDVMALAYGENNPSVSAVDPNAMLAQSDCQTAIGAAATGYVSTKLEELEQGSSEAVAEAAAIGSLSIISSQCSVTVAQDQSGVVLPSVGPQCAAAVGAVGNQVDVPALTNCLHTLLDVWVQRFGPSPQPLAPNIIVFMVDDMRWDEMGPAHSIQGDNMPRTLQEVRDQGIALTNAYATTPLCCPSRATILTGQYTHTHGVHNNGASTPVADGGATAFPDASTVATSLQAAGYRTGLVGKYLNYYNLLWTPGQTPYIPPGWDDWYGMQAHNYYNYKMVERPKGGAIAEIFYGSTAADYSTDVIREKTKTFITSAAASSQPFFFMTSFNAPHSPHPMAAARHAGLFSALAPWGTPNTNEADTSDKPSWLRGKALLSPSVIATTEADRRDSGELLLAVDEAIGGSLANGITGIIETLQSTGVYDNTVIVFMSDHGYLWTEHRLTGKPFVYEETSRIPLMIRYPRLVPLPRQDAAMALTNDIAPTLIELAGGQPLPGSEGRSLLRVLDGTEHNWRSDFMIEGWPNHQEFAAVRDDSWKYVEYSPQAGGGRELYDLVNDPYELTSLHADPQQVPRIQAMHARLMQLRPNWPADAP